VLFWGGAEDGSSISKRKEPVYSGKSRGTRQGWSDVPTAPHGALPGVQSPQDLLALVRCGYTSWSYVSGTSACLLPFLWGVRAGNSWAGSLT
jgi:hypothetical protein